MFLHSPVVLIVAVFWPAFGHPKSHGSLRPQSRGAGSKQHNMCFVYVLF